MQLGIARGDRDQVVGHLQITETERPDEAERSRTWPSIRATRVEASAARWSRRRSPSLATSRAPRSSSRPRAPLDAQEHVADSARMDDPATKVADLLHEAGETHHTVYRITDGDDPDWASWYADWLIRLSELPQILGTTPVRSELVWMLVQLDKDYPSAAADTPWPRWYAERLVEHFRS